MKKILFLLLLSSAVQAQSDLTGNIVGQGKPYKDKIALRWNITNYQVFKQLLTDGVHVERMVMNRANQVEGNGWTRISTQPIKAKTLAEIQRSPFASDTAVAVLTEGLYGKTVYPENLSLTEQIRFQDMDQQNRHLIVSLYSALSKDAALLAGLAFEDALRPDSTKNYVYRIVPTRPKGFPGKIETGFIYVAGRDVNVTPVHFGLRSRSMENAIVLGWPVSESPFTGYYVERSEDNKKFTRLNKQVYLPDMSEDSTATEQYFSYRDSVANYKTYYYRLIGVNAFGEQLPFRETVKGMAQDYTAVSPPLLEMTKDGKKAVLKWTVPEEKDLKGYYLLQGKTIEANDGLLVSEMLKPQVNTYTYTLPADFKATYLRLMVADTAGNTSFTNAVYIFEPDLIPPAPPTGLSGKIDSSGVVLVKWSLDLKEEAIRGYKVLIANQGDHNFTPVSDIVSDTTYTFQTELKTLTRKLWVKVIAVDGNFNHSQASKALVLERPDIVPPATPQLLDYTNDQKGIELRWSTAKSSDLKENILYRKIQGEAEWKEQFRTSKASSYLDKNVASGLSYEYSMRALDSSGLYSEYAHPLVIRTSNAPVSETVSLSGTYQQSKKTVLLRWAASKEAVAFYVLYKDQGEGLSMYKSLPAGSYTYEEEGTTPPKGRYALRIKYANQKESDLLICK